MNELLQWTDQFRRTTINKNDIVAFDLLGGDFNLDNMSPGIYSSEWHGCYKKIKLVPAITMFLNLYLIVFILKVFSIVIGVYKNYK